MGVQKGSKIVIDGLVACWDFSSKACYGGSGSTCSDVAGRNIGTFSTPTFVNDGVKSALRFDYTNSDIMTIQNTAQLTFGTGDFSVEAWVLCKQAYAGTSPGSKYPSVIVLGDQNGMALFRSTGAPYESTHFRAQVVSEGYTHSLTDDLLVNTWYHIVCTRTGNYTSSTGKYTYVNGDGGTTGAGDGNWTSGGGLPEWQMGRGYTTYYLDGDIAIVRVYNRVLTAAEIKTNYDQAKGRFQ